MNINPELTDKDLMPFGKHKGKAMANVPGKYLLWLHNEGCHDAQVRKYINDNLDAILAEAARANKFKSYR